LGGIPSARKGLQMKDYIGDGVYVEFDGFGIELRANSPDSPHVIYLEPQVLEALNRFAKRCAAQQSVQADGACSWCTQAADPNNHSVTACPFHNTPRR
jgi:hypothetical protein